MKKSWLWAITFVLLIFFLDEMGDRQYSNIPPLTDGVRLVVIGDFGMPGEPADRVSNMVSSWNPTAIITVGDNSQLTWSNEDYEKFIYPRYKTFIDSQTFFPALGNHDWGHPGGTVWKADSLPLVKNLPYLPGNQRYYQVSFSGLVDIFILDSDIYEPDGRTLDHHRDSG